MDPNNWTVVGAVLGSILVGVTAKSNRLLHGLRFATYVIFSTKKIICIQFLNLDDYKLTPQAPLHSVNIFIAVKHHKSLDLLQFHIVVSLLTSKTQCPKGARMCTSPLS